MVLPVKKAWKVLREEGPLELSRKTQEYCGRFVPDIARFQYGFRRTITNPNILLGHLKTTGALPVNSQVTKHWFDHRQSTNVFDEEWDNLIILDACRFDYYEEETSISEGLEKIRSVAPNTPLFLDNSLNDDHHHDTVYVTANPRVEERERGTFHNIINVWKEEWDEEIQSVRPENMTDCVLKAHADFPDKRLVAHYIQPHTPYIGERGKVFLNENMLSGRRKEGINEESIRIMNAIRYGLIDISDAYLHKLYRENLQVCLEGVEALVEQLPGKTIITADHGEHLGETVGPIPYKVYGHPPLYTKELLEVPLHVIDGERRETTPEPPIDAETVDEQEIEDRLQYLGYKT